MAFQFVQILYWLALATWFGGALFIAVASRIIFKTIAENEPILPHVLSVNLQGQHGTLLAGTIMGNILTTFFKIEISCCAALLIASAAQCIFIDMHDAAVVAPQAVRFALLLAAGTVVVYDWRFIWPRLWQSRQEFLDNADEPEKANPAKDRFDRFQNQSVVLLEILLFLLLGIVLFSAGVAVHAVPTILPHPGGDSTDFPSGEITHAPSAN